MVFMFTSDICLYAYVSQFYSIVMNSIFLLEVGVISFLLSLSYGQSYWLYALIESIIKPTQYQSYMLLSAPFSIILILSSPIQVKCLDLIHNVSNMCIIYS